MSQLHRLQWIDARIRAGGLPNCRAIAERFEISLRQASRDIEYLRDSMGAPVAPETPVPGAAIIGTASGRAEGLATAKRSFHALQTA